MLYFAPFKVPKPKLTTTQKKEKERFKKDLSFQQKSISDSFSNQTGRDVDEEVAVLEKGYYLFWSKASTTKARASKQWLVLEKCVKFV